MLIGKPQKIPSSEIVSPGVYRNRRRFIGVAGAAALGAVLPSAPAVAAAPLETVSSDYTVDSPITPREKVTTYNNFYELGTDKEDPSSFASLYSSRPWQVEVTGEVAKPKVFDIDDLMGLSALEDRVYRMRCVEAWSMVIPWVGFSLSKLADVVEPTSNAKYVEFVTFNPERLFPSEANASLDWPYVEGLRMDEAMHPLTLLTFGVFGETLPNQNGAPVKIVSPWKYGFKNGKALVRIEFKSRQPRTTWNQLAPREYGFYANVNPEVSHPRWSQARERLIVDGFFPVKRDTEPFNGYADEVAGLYSGMNLSQNY